MKVETDAVLVVFRRWDIDR